VMEAWHDTAIPPSRRCNRMTCRMLSFHARRTTMASCVRALQHPNAQALLRCTCHSAGLHAAAHRE
jgi:hypothetical protein